MKKKHRKDDHEDEGRIFQVKDDAGVGRDEVREKQKKKRRNRKRRRRRSQSNKRKEMKSRMKREMQGESPSINCFELWNHVPQKYHSQY